MNHIIYNISLLILVIGIILMTIYITKASNNGYLNYYKNKLNQYRNKLIRRSQTIYDYSINKEYQKMFSQPSLWMGYQTFDQKDKIGKIFVK